MSESLHGTTQKNQRMHEMALAMYRTADYHAAFKIWRRLYDQDPEFPDIEKWIELAGNALQKGLPGRQKPSPAVYRLQRDIMVSQGRGPRNRIFHPRTSHVRLKKGIRHRHVVAIFLTVMLIIFLTSIRNNRSYLIQLNPQTHKLECYQGSFFPVGWRKTLVLDVGIENDWVKYVEDQEVIRKLQRGITTHSVKRFNEQIVAIFVMLGDESLTQMTERGQQSAIYYYKRVVEARFADLVTDKIIRAFLNCAEIKIATKDYEGAQSYLDSAREYNQKNPELLIIQRELDALTQKSNPRY